MTDNYSAASTLANLGSTALLLGQTERARVLLAEGLRLAYDVGNKHIIAYYLLPMGLLEAGVGQWSNSVYLLSAAKRLLEQIGSALGPKDELRYDQTLADARSHLDSGVYTSIWTQGHMELLGQIVAKALALQPNLRTNE
ncbi:MAG: hypothetical protein JWQ02_1697 [Capsulimonas sp.]|nr:hypothetical protein [Capsulimonas sp.]